MDKSKERFIENSDNSHSEDESTENRIFEFKRLEIDDSKTAQEKSDERCLSEVTKVQPKDEVLPSQVTDQPYIYLENDDCKIDEHMQAGGKWMIFTQGDLKKLDFYWVCLKILFFKGSVKGLKASTFANHNSGVINCYTTDAENWVEIKKVAAAIRDAIDYPFIMYYKTNEASAQGHYREKGCKLISRYMFTVKGGFYEKDKFGRWEWV